ncbi:hypothetical protein H8E77_17250 [bacterium]|nr:hypothetical protein [bacterium]
MKYETPCPVCGQSISIWKMMVTCKSFYLKDLKCLKCDSKIRVKGWTWPSLIIVMMIGVYLGWLVGLSYLIAYKHIFSGLLSSGLATLFVFAIIVGGMIVLTIIWAIIASLLIINKGTLIEAKKSP